MNRIPAWTTIACALCTIPLLAQDAPKRAKIKSVDADKGLITLTVDGKDAEFAVSESTRIMDAAGRPARLKDGGFKESAPVMFKAEQKGGKTVLVGLKLVGEDNPRTLEKADTAKLKPLTELGKNEYKGFKGGLYPDGKNERPGAHEQAGLALAGKVVPLDADGKSASAGKIVMLSIGMSNTTQEFSAFQRIANADKDKNPSLLVVDGAQGAMPAMRILDPQSKNGGEQYWTEVDRRLTRAGATRAQVQVAWIKQANPQPTEGFPKYAQALEKDLATIVKLLHTRFPNVKLVYLSSRIYAGYANTPLNPEPYAYESGFSVKWLIEKQIKGAAELNYDPDKGKVIVPWLSWGPYLWANGTTKRADGLTYDERDFAGDGTHPSDSGREKVARQLLEFFKTDSTTKPWFVKK